LFRPDLHPAGGSRAAGDIAKHLVDQFLEPRAHTLALQVGAHQAYAAIDIEAHAARRNHAVRTVHGRHAAYREAVSLVNVGHRQAGPHDATQRGHVHGLLERQVAPDLLQQPRAGIHHHVGQHATAFVPRDAVAERVDLFEADGGGHQISR